jgi:hypothetical protein
LHHGKGYQFSSLQLKDTLRIPIFGHFELMAAFSKKTIRVLVHSSPLILLLVAFIADRPPSALVQMPDDNIWKQSEAADDNFLSNAMPDYELHNVRLGALSDEDISPKPNTLDFDSQQHPEAERSGVAGSFSPHWAKRFLLDRPASAMHEEEALKASGNSVDIVRPLKVKSRKNFCQDARQSLQGVLVCRPPTHTLFAVASVIFCADFSVASD